MAGCKVDIFQIRLDKYICPPSQPHHMSWDIRLNEELIRTFSLTRERFHCPLDIIQQKILYGLSTEIGRNAYSYLKKIPTEYCSVHYSTPPPNMEILRRALEHVGKYDIMLVEIVKNGKLIVWTRGESDENPV